MKSKILTLVLFSATLFMMNEKASACLYGGGFTAFTYNDSIGCKTRFTADSPMNNNINYLWDFGDGATSTDQDAWHRYANSGTYNVTLIVNGYGCADTVTQSVYVRPCDSCDLDASFTVQDTVYCQKVFYPNTIEHYEYSYSWDFGDGITSTDMIPWHEYQNPGMYNVTAVISSNFCADTVTQTITVLPCDSCDIDASFGYYDSACYTGFVPSVYNNNPNAQYEWYFGDGTTSTDVQPEHLYNTPGTYTVTLFVNDGACTDSTMQNVVVPPCDSCDLETGFTATENGQNTYDFSPTLYDSNNSYLWVFGDGTTSSDAYPTHQFLEEGDYYVTLVVSNCTCSTSSTEEIHVSDSTSCPFDAGFTYTVSNNGVYTFTPDYQSSNYSYDWDFGDGTFSSTMSPSYAYSSNGTYTVSLSVWETNGGWSCVDTTEQTVLVSNTTPCNQSNGIEYSWSSNNDYIHFSPEFYNSNYGYYWDFGDGNTSNWHSPNHTYANNGNYVVTLQVTTFDTNCVIIDTININVQTAGIDTQNNPSSDEVSIYPNPAKEVVYLNFNLAKDGNYTIRMIDAIGQLVRQNEMQLFRGENEKEISLNSLSKGMYQIQIRDQEGKLIKASKLIKE